MNIFGIFIIALLSMFTALKLCGQDFWVLWVVGQFTLGASITLWFKLLQSFAAGKEIKYHWLNLIGGHIASFFVVLPFNQFRYQTPQAIPLEKKFFPPLNVMLYSMKNFWNIKKLFNLFPDKKIRFQFILSIFVMNFLFFYVIPTTDQFWKKHIVGYLLFLVAAERIIERQQAAESQDLAPEL